MFHNFFLYNRSLHEIDQSKMLINTLNAHSYNLACKDEEFRNALKNSDVLLPDGISVVLATRVLSEQKLNKIAGEDLFYHEMKRLNSKGGKCFFLGSTDKTLKLISDRAKTEFPQLKIYYYSPPFKAQFSEEDNISMINAINEVEPDVLFIGMTAPKQEKWAYKHFEILNAGHICCIGAVFDYYAGTIKRAPKWMISIGLEWMYRLIREPKRLWRRYLLGNTQFVIHIIKEKFSSRKKKSEAFNPVVNSEQN